MKIVRFAEEGQTFWGVLKDGSIQKIAGNVYDELIITDQTVLLDDVTLLAPCTPSKAVCVGLNYNDHKSKTEMEEPILFLKPPSAVNHPGGFIEYPQSTQDLQYEAELAVVIKKTARHVSEAAAHEYILGYTCANDVSARDLQKKDGQWTRGKSFDSFMPLGPCVETEIAPDNLDIRLYLNNEIRQSSNTCNLLFRIPYLIAFISAVMTLYPGDVILTGSPRGVGPMQSGDTVIVELEGIGRLVNQVRK